VDFYVLCGYCLFYAFHGFRYFADVASEWISILGSDFVCRRWILIFRASYAVGFCRFLGFRGF